MAYEIIGKVLKVYEAGSRNTRNGITPTQKVKLEHKRFNQMTGEAIYNYPVFEFQGARCDALRGISVGDMIKLHFDIIGYDYDDKETGEVKNFTAIRPFRIEVYSIPINTSNDEQQ